MRLGERAEAIELAGARASAAVHLRDKSAAFTLCGRGAHGARVLNKLVDTDFDPNDPDTRVCRRCLYLSAFHPGTVVSSSQ